jgi:acyl-CoA hydrolase
MSTEEAAALILPAHRKPIILTTPSDRIGEPYLRVDPNKVIAVVETDAPRPQHPVQRPRRGLEEDRRAHPGVLRARRSQGPAAEEPAAAS